MIPPNSQYLTSRMPRNHAAALFGGCTVHMQVHKQYRVVSESVRKHTLNPKPQPPKPLKPKP